ncbi:MAG: hypothetical protein GWO87_01595 [Xanthomonadaceae bacterium]|nr:hypothetical protein [Rhodospirillaceae bacterium]NIA17865.1 hypothetical protein [Xanthomonadaceae bacterium]
MLTKEKEKLNNEKKIYLRIKVNPKASKSKIKNILADKTIKIDIASLPEKGRANAELIKLLSKEFCVEKNKIKIISGSKNKLKLVKITTI